MTGLSPWQAGQELTCPTCVFVTSDATGEPACIIALEVAQFGETLTAAACPRSMAGVAA